MPLTITGYYRPKRLSQGNRGVRGTQWHKNGDMPEDDLSWVPAPLHGGGGFWSEGKIVRYYRHPNHSGREQCPFCGCTLHYHGWIDQGDEGLTVCPGDFVLKIGDGYYPVKPELMTALMELVA